MTRVRARLAPGDEPHDFAYVVDAGDLDGDGFADLLDVRERGVAFDSLDGWTAWRFTTTVAAYRGRDAKPLWSRTFSEGDDVFAFPARVGPAGTRGVMFAVYSGLYQGMGAGDGGMSLVAVDAAGREVWTARAPGGYAGAYPLVTYADAGAYAVMVDTFDGVQGPATDLLVAVVAPAGADRASVEAERLLVVNGADGTVSDTGIATVQRDGYVGARAAPDLDRDGLDDVAILSGEYDATSTTVAAFPGAGGPALWTTVVPSGHARHLVAVGDATGDGTAELAVGTSGGHLSDDATSHLLDGKTGKRRWTKKGRAVPVGDVDRDRRAEVGLLRYATNGPASVRAEVVDAAGALRWRVTRSLPAPAGDAECPSPGACEQPNPPGSGPTAQDTAASEVATNVGLGGDLNADGVTDFAFSVVVTPRGERTRRDEGWIDGRTGRVRRDPAPELVLLHRAVDGRGADSARTALTNGQLTVSVYAPDRGRLLWRTTIAVASGSRSPFGRTAVNLTSRRCADVLVSVTNRATTQTIAYHGATGKPMWSISRDGGRGTPKVSRPAVRDHVDRNNCP